MARIEKTIFISYRRTDVYTALAVYENLKNKGFDVFFDYRSISSGDFEQIITSNIRARAHFILILTPNALDRCNEPGDWLSREIELAIDEKRNIVPLFFKGFRFGAPSISEKLTDKIKKLSRYNGLNVHEDYFDEGMDRLRTQFLNKPLNTVLHPVSTEVQKVVREEQVAADKALEKKIDGMKESVKRIDEKPKTPNGSPGVEGKAAASVEITHQESAVANEQPKEVLYQEDTAPKRTFYIAGLFAGALLLIALSTWGGITLWNNMSSVSPERTLTLQPINTQTVDPFKTRTPSPTKTSRSPLSTISPTVQGTPVLRVVDAFAGGGGAHIREVPNGKILATIPNGTVVTIIPNESQIIKGTIWVHVFVFVNDVRIEGWMDGSVVINTVTSP
jgi:hypothetical protein